MNIAFSASLPPQPSSHSRARTLAVFCQPSSWSKRILLGMASYLHRNSEWNLSPFECHEQGRERVREQRFAGAFILDWGKCDEEAIHPIIEDLPSVVIGCSRVHEGVTTLAIDEHAVATMAASALGDRGFKSVAFVGHMGHRCSMARQAAFCDVLRKQGIAPFLFLTQGTVRSEFEANEDLLGMRLKLKRWIGSLPDPTGLYAVDDELAYECYRAALDLGRSIPEQLAIIGTNDDELLSKITRPSLSSIRLPFEKMGFDAAKALLAQLRERGRANGRSASVNHLLYPPTGLIFRESLNTFVAADPVVNQAVRFIQEHYADPINVESIISALQVSRSVLERRFREDLGVTPLTQLRRTRIERARQLLSDGSRSIQAVGQQCGFSSAIRFTTVFKESVGLTPSAFRKQMIPDSIK